MIPSVKIVHPNWLFDSMSNWRRSPEDEFEIKIQKNLSQKEVDAYKEKLAEQESKAKENGEIEELLEKEGDLLGGDMNWLDIDEEVEEFLNSDSEDEEEENNGGSNKRGLDSDSEDGEMKRRKQEDEDNSSDDDLAAELMLGLDGDDEDGADE